MGCEVQCSTGNSKVGCHLSTVALFLGGGKRACSEAWIMSGCQGKYASFVCNSVSAGHSLPR